MFFQALNRPFCSTAKRGDSHCDGGVKVRKFAPFALRAYHLGAIAHIVIFQTAETTKPLIFLENQGLYVYRMWR